MDPFNAPAPPPSSRERLDRLRERTAAPVPRARRSTAPWVASAVLLAFALGMIANPWFEHRVRSLLPGFAETTGANAGTVAAQAQALAALQARVAALEARPVPAPGAAVAAVGPAGDSGERLARLETRLDDAERGAPATSTRVDKLAADVAALGGRFDAGAAATQASLTKATAAADEAQTLLVLGAARRALDGGARLGALEPALRRQLGARYPQEVEAVAALGAAPVTPLALRQAFDAARAPAAAKGASWWDSLSATFDTVVHVRSAPDGDGRGAAVERAAVLLRSGNIAGARDQVAALPAAERAPLAGWLAAADRYLGGMRALSGLETTTLTAPR